MRLRTTYEGPERLWHGTSDAIETLDRASSDAALVYLDPPFGTGKQFYLSASTSQSGDGRLAYEDPLLDRPAHLEQARSSARSCADAVRPEGVVVVHTDSNCTHLYRLAFEDIFGADAFRGEIIVRSGSRDESPRPHLSPGLTATHNTLLLFSKSELPTASALPRYSARSCQGGSPNDAGALIDTLWCDIDVRGRSSVYPTEKSFPFAHRILQWFTEPGDLVVEPYAGSGAFSRCALSLGRRVLAGDTSAVAAAISGVSLASELVARRLAGSVEIPIDRGCIWGADLVGHHALGVVAVSDEDRIVAANPQPCTLDPMMFGSKPDWLAVITHRGTLRVGLADR